MNNMIPSKLNSFAVLNDFIYQRYRVSAGATDFKPLHIF